MKQTNKSDERMTTFALEEMQGPERERFEKDLDASVGIQNEVNDIKYFTRALRQDLSQEVLPDRDVKLYKNVMNKVGIAGSSSNKNKNKTLWWSAGLLAAASVVGVSMLPRLFENSKLAGPMPLAESQREKSGDVLVIQPTESVRAPSGYMLGGQKPPPPGTQMGKTMGFTNRGKADQSFGFAKGGLRDVNPHYNTEAYDYLLENPFKSPTDEALSTFSIDVDTASYANVRRFVTGRSLPPKDSIRIEEMVNYFPYTYLAPVGEQPFAVALEVAQAPWKEEHRLIKIGIKAKDIEWGQTPPSNLVFLIDISGSMNDSNKLPLLKKSLKMLVERLGNNDRVAIVVYAGASGLVLPSTSANHKQMILDKLEQLSAGGSTNGGQGIELAYSVALENYIKGGINRVIIATDGDFNLGVTSQGQLSRLIEEKAKAGVFLTVLGFGMGNYKDSTLDRLAGIGNGNYAYIDNENEARKVLVEQIGGTMMIVAKDVKIQVEFNPAKVESYRLIGYENRVLANQDFNDDAKDAGDIGAGHTVTAFYEVVPKRFESQKKAVDPLKYQTPATIVNDSEELVFVKLRYKRPDEQKSSLIELGLKDQGHTFASASEDFRFAAAVAGVGMVLRDSKYKGSATLNSMLKIVNGAIGRDTSGYRKEFSDLVRTMEALSQ